MKLDFGESFIERTNGDQYECGALKNEPEYIPKPNKTVR